MSKFGDALRAAIKDRKMSQRQLGSNIGVSEYTVSKYVNGLSVPRKKRVMSIEQTLALEIGTLQKLIDEEGKVTDDEETREEKILKAWKRGERTPYEVAEITGYPIKVVKKYLPLGLER